MSKPEPTSPSADHADLPWLGPRADYQPVMPVTDPPGRVVFGGVIVFGVFMAWQFESLVRVRYWFLFFACFGVAMMLSGILQQRHDARIRREIRRAKAQWTTLLAEAADAPAQDEGFSRLLKRHGYRNYFVRRWLLARLKQSLARREARQRG